MIKFQLTCLAALTLAANAWSQGDDCASATSLAGATGLFAFDTTLATDSGALPSCNGSSSMISADHWYSWTSGPATSYQFEVCNASYDVVMALYDSCGGVELGCEESGGCGGGIDSVTMNLFGLTPNTTYLLQLDGWGGDAGTGMLDISEIVPPVNDTCAGAIAVGAGGTAPVDNEFASPTTSPSACLSGGSADVWYSWTAGAGADYRFRVQNATFDYLVSVRSSCGSVELGCDGNELDLTGLTPGATYLVQVDSEFGGTGSGDLEIIPIAIPPNDTCATALPLSTVGVFPFDTTFATDSGALPSCNGSSFMASSDIWYTWTSGSAADYRFEVCDASYDVVIALYDACAGIELGCEESGGCVGGIDSVTMDVLGLTPNTTYLLQIDGWGAAEGTGMLDITSLGGPLTIGTNYCLSLPNSSGNAAEILAYGSTSTADANLSLQATGLPAGVSAIFFYGTTQVAAPFGDGFRCAGGGVQRLPFNNANSMGVLMEPDVFAHPMPSVPIAPGTLNFQAWYRDPSAMMTGFNLSDGVGITFVP